MNGLLNGQREVQGMLDTEANNLVRFVSQSVSSRSSSPARIRLLLGDAMITQQRHSFSSLIRVHGPALGFLDPTAPKISLSQELPAQPDPIEDQQEHTNYVRPHLLVRGIVRNEKAEHKDDAPPAHEIQKRAQKGALIDQIQRAKQHGPQPRDRAAFDVVFIGCLNLRERKGLLFSVGLASLTDVIARNAPFSETAQ
jgi:hypothetical protein